MDASDEGFHGVCLHFLRGPRRSAMRLAMRASQIQSGVASTPHVVQVSEEAQIGGTTTGFCERSVVAIVENT